MDGVSVNPPYSAPGSVSASLFDNFQKSWREWRKAGAAARGDGVSRAELDVGGRFAYDVVEQKADERDAWLGPEGPRVHGPRATRPLRLILTGGAGSGKSTTIRALVRRRRMRTEERLSRVVASPLLKQQRMKCTAVLSAPTGTASFQMKYGAQTAHSAWGVMPMQ